MTEKTSYGIADRVNYKVARPSVSFSSITFSDGTTVSLAPDDIVAFVGPNNAGKSVVLRELEEWVGGEPADRRVVKDRVLNTTGTVEDFAAFLDERSPKRFDGPEREYRGINYNLTAYRLKEVWPNDLGQLRSVFCLRVATESRITGSNQVRAIHVLADRPSNAIHLLYMDDTAEARISRYFTRAFNKDLALFRSGGREWPLYVGRKPGFLPNEQSYEKGYIERFFKSMQPLQDQGDGMRSFATVLLELLAPQTQSILLLDEPEAFLHPPQARLLGEIIVRERPKETQLFVSTHSADVLQGLLNAASGNLRILRLQRDGAINPTMELDKASVRRIAADPLMKFSNVLDGIFYQRVVVAEADSDCLFYSAVLDVPSVNGSTQPDVLFIHASGKDRMASLASTLRAMGVRVDVIADIDVLREDGTLRKIVEALGGDWSVISGLASSVRNAIEQKKPWLNAAELKNGIIEVLEKVEAPGIGEFPRPLKSEIDGLFRKALPWDAVKQSGISALPAGDATKDFSTICELCGAFGLWIVPQGEIEGFCRSVGGHGPKWVQEVLETKDLANDEDLGPARTFVKKVWDGV